MMALRSRFAPLRLQPSTVALVALLLAAFGLRVYGLNWDDGHYLHPDERFIAIVISERVHLDWPPSIDNLLDPATSGLNPRSVNPNDGKYREFAYGALPLFVTDVAAELIGRVDGSDRDWHGYGQIYKVGRSISALLDTLTVLLIYLIGRRAFSARVALGAATVAALAPMSIQLAHFFTTDSWLTFFVALCLLCAVRAAEGGSWRWFVAAGAAFGLAMATKGSVFTLAGLIAMTGLYDVWRRWQTDAEPVAALAQSLARLAVAGMATVVTFALFEPYALVNPGIYLDSLQTQAEIVSGRFDVPFTRQYIGTPRIIYQVEQLVRWGLGPVGGVLAIGGLLVLTRCFWQRRGPTETLALAWFLGYGLVVAIPETKFLRYLSPLIPVMALAAGLSFDSLWRLLARRGGSRLATGVTAVLLAGAALWTGAFESVYANQNPRIVASEWIYANVPAGSRLSAEYWDDALPMLFGPGLTPWDRQFETVTFDLYRDRPSLRELRPYTDILRQNERTRPAAEAIERHDETAAADLLRTFAASAATLSTADRRQLADDLDRAASQLTLPATGSLEAATRDAAVVLRADGTVPANAAKVTESVRKLADAVRETVANEATNAVYRDLEQVDYVILSSNRLSASIPRSPWRYPVQTRYYELLRSGELGFTLVEDFQQLPHIGPLTINDGGADESFTVYDHPRVLIFKKDRLVERAEFDALMASAANQPVSPTRHAPDTELMLDRPPESLPVVADVRWSEPLTRRSAVAFVVWVVLLFLLQLAGWPLACLVFGRFADAGWGLARVTILLIIGYVVWIGASTQVIAFRAVWCAGAMLAIGLASWVAWRRSPRVRRVWSLRPGQRRVALSGEALFWVVFGVFLLFRYLNPDSWHPIWGGEKPMEFAHINATLRSAHFPPVDPWYAGGYLNYYYYGLYLVAFLIKLTGIPSEIAFNLAQPTMLALLASAGFSVAAALGRDLTRDRRAAIPAGALGVVLLVGIGNLNGFLMFGQKLQGVAEYPFNYVWNPTRSIHLNSTLDAITEFPFFTGLYADLHAHVVGLPITVLAIALGYALARDPQAVALAISRPSRAKVATAIVGARLGLLALTVGTLFPTNAWDMATYVALAAVAVLMATARVRPISLRVAVAAAGALAVSAVAYALFLPFHANFVAVAGSITTVEAPTDLWQFASHLGGLLAIVAFGLVVIALPTRARAGGLLREPLVPVAVVLAFALARRVVGNREPALADALAIGFVLAIAATFALAGWTLARAGPRLARFPLARVVLVIGFAAVLAAFADRQPTLGLFLAFAMLGSVVWLSGAGEGERYVGLMVAAAALVGAGVEIVVVSDRVNTIFKFYNQLWVLLALSGAAVVVKMIVAARWDAGATEAWFGRSSVLGVVQNPSATAREIGRTGRADEREALLPAPTAWSRVGLAVAATVIAASLFYPVLAISPRLHQRFADHLGSGTLNALDWMDYGTLPADAGMVTFNGDRAAIDWLNEHAKGTPVIAEASIGGYRGNGSRISIATGLPTVIGWEYHESQQRHADTLPGRVTDVRRLYDSSDPTEKLAILNEYGVRYVVVGDVERLSRVDGRPYASAEGIAAFDEMVGDSLTVAFTQDGTTIYRVGAASA